MVCLKIPDLCQAVGRQDATSLTGKANSDFTRLGALKTYAETREKC